MIGWVWFYYNHSDWSVKELLWLCIFAVIASALAVGFVAWDTWQ